MAPQRDAQGRFVKTGGATFVPNPAGLVELLDSPTGVVGKDLLRRVLAVNNEAKRLCPVRTGRLRSSIRWRIERDVRGRVGIVGTDVEYAIFVHQGTRGGTVITPVNKEALYWEGAEHPVASVTRGDTRAQPFLTDALRVAIV